MKKNYLTMIDKNTIDKMYLIYRKSCDVINFLRGGLQESAYHAALEWELTQRGNLETFGWRYFGLRCIDHCQGRYTEW